MKHKTYTELLKDPRWQRKRLEILNRDNFTCQKCKDTKTTLHIHHKKYIPDKKPWEYENNKLTTLCEDCHKIVEELKSEIDFSKIKIYKSTGWRNGNKIIFITHSNICSMQIYDATNNYLVGFNFCNDDDKNNISNIIKIFTQAKNNKCCPHDHKFGVDNSKFKECDDCRRWYACDERDLRNLRHG